MKNWCGMVITYEDAEKLVGIENETALDNMWDSEIESGNKSFFEDKALLGAFVKAWTKFVRDVTIDAVRFGLDDFGGNEPIK